MGLILVLGLAVAGCSSISGPTSRTDGNAKITGTIKISGSGTCLPLLKVLEPEFARLNPTVRVVFLPGVHSSGGIKGVQDGTLDVGAVSRPLKPDEKKLGLVYWRLSEDALAVATHAGVGPQSLSVAQLKDIYRGKITNWKQLGGKNLAITVLDRNEDESAKIVFREHALGPNLKILPEAVNLYYESDMVDGLLNTPGAIGYLSYGYVKSKRLDVRLALVDGVGPSVANVKNGSYGMVRDLGIVTKKRPSPAARLFVEYITSKSAASRMARFGFAPLQGT